MSLVSLEVGPNNPVTSTTLSSTLARLGVALPPAEIADYTALLAGAHETFQKVLDMPDYVPLVDEARFSRENVHFPSAEENPANAWAWKATVKSASLEGLLAGKTVCLKDNVALRGVPCLLGTDSFKDWTPNTDATIVTRILEDGGEILGKAVCENLCLWGASNSSATGYIDNFYAKGYSAGGSSSGTAVLVARGDCDLGIGGDQGGSIRLPAAHNGIVGFKPTSGLVPYTGIGSLEQGIDHAGPMTRTVADNALLLQVIAGVDGMDDRQQAGCPFPKDVPDYPALSKLGVKGLRIGLLREGFQAATADPRVSALVEKAAQELTKLGATVEDVSVPFHFTGPELWMVICRLSGTTSMVGKASGRRVLYLNDLTEKMVLSPESFSKLFPSAANLLVNGAYAQENFSPALLGKAMNLGRKLKDDYDAAQSKFDVLILPTVPWVTKTLASPTSTVLELFSKSHGLTVNTNPFNLTGHPALSLPVGFLSPLGDEKIKLPIGMQIVGKWYDEATVLRVAQAWEAANDWKTFA